MIDRERSEMGVFFMRGEATAEMKKGAASLGSRNMVPVIQSAGWWHEHASASHSGRKMSRHRRGANGKRFPPC